MRNLTRISLALTGSAALALIAVVPANAADTLTVSITGGSLAITTGDNGLALGAVVPGAPSTGTLTGVTATDSRAGVEGWVAQATVGAFESSTADTVATTSMSTAALTYTATVPAVTGTVTATNAAAVELSGTAVSVVTADAVSGVNTATWDAGLSVAIPAQALAGTYTAVLTHSIL
ncbi:MAG TPA: hypothetical protein VGP24_02560 [Glaciihabitans sp.]|nr:hypothetical protein [Glaciihabitans sp.]